MTGVTYGLALTASGARRLAEAADAVAHLLLVLLEPPLGAPQEEPAAGGTLRQDVARERLAADLPGSPDSRRWADFGTHAAHQPRGLTTSVDEHTMGTTP